MNTKMVIQSLIFIAIVLLLMAGMDYALIYFFKKLAYSPPSWAGIFPFGETLFIAISLYLFSMFMFIISKKVLGLFNPIKSFFWIVGIICFINFIFLVKELWNNTPNFSFWNVITFIMCFSVISLINFIFIAPFTSNE